MKKLSLLLFCLLVIGLGIYFTIQRQDQAPNDDIIPPPTGDQKNEKKPSTPRDPLQEQLAQMTLEEKVGQLVIVGMDGTELNEKIKNLIQNYHAGGVILYKKNITGSTQLLQLLNQLKSSNNSKIPLFLSLDEEGGPVSRLPDEITKLPSNKIIGEINNENLSYNLGQALALQLKAYGFNLNFAPVLDINSNPQNPVIGDRSFGAGADLVSRLGVATIKGLQDGGVIPVGKHFPGHGDTLVDSHVGLPVVTYDLDRLRNFELLPFQAAIGSGVDAMMVAHILLPKLDDKFPASLSHNIITGLLKEELGFQGLVVTDDLTMGAIVKHYSLAQAAVQAVKAGNDLLLVCHDYESQLAVLQALQTAVASGDIPEARIEESVYKILQLKQKYNLSDRPVEAVDTEAVNAKVRKLLDSFLMPAN
ncbi:MAG: beta-N-acetylhexosaminidase [Firmicutes bacterium]|nr:beta-N-acetylhexosaminidase [Bacillota bacterium]